jgi:diacylglycerol kinase family enzyme
VPAQLAHEVALLCNPQAGGRWRVLADVLDSYEAKAAYRVVTDDINNIREALSALGQRVKLLCIYGGDGTIFRVINELLRQPGTVLPRLAFLGGGTMNVTSAWCGMSQSAGENFRNVMRAYLAGELQWREVPLVAVTNGGRTGYGFTFGLGPLVRIVRRFEESRKSRLRAVAIGLTSMVGAVTGVPKSWGPTLREMVGKVVADGETLPYNRYAAVFANVTGVINPGVKPFVGERTRDSFHFCAYAVSSREFAVMAPLLLRAQIPIDPLSLLRPVPLWRQALLSLLGRGELPVDKRYVNHPARQVVIETPEECYTIDGEVILADGPRFELALGPQLQLATLPGPLLRRLLPDGARIRRGWARFDRTPTPPQPLPKD